MSELESSPLNREYEGLPQPAFETDIVTINFISSNPQGIDVDTHYSMSRREDIDKYPLTDDQRVALKAGMRDEVAFVLKRKKLFTKEMKDEKDPERQWQLVTAALEANNINLTEEMAYKLGIRNQRLEGNTLWVDVKDVPYPSYEIGSNPHDSKESQDLTNVAAVAGILVTKDKNGCPNALR
ncbi:MAG: hypothetical protein AAB478_03860 [Patescibacteria group bacterium]